MISDKDKALLALFNSSGQKFTYDTIDTGEAPSLTTIFFKHASLAFIWNGKVVYVDPLMEYADYSVLPKADLVLVTHEHYDHLDKEAINSLLTPQTIVIGSLNVAAEYERAEAMKPGESNYLGDGLTVEAVPAYNVSAEQLQFHPKERGDNGYVIDFSGVRVYIAGDTEPIPEMAELRKIDVMLLPVNQPYTMTPQQAAEAARTIGAPIFYPYHTGDTEMEKVRAFLADTPSICVRIFPME